MSVTETVMTGSALLTASMRAASGLTSLKQLIFIAGDCQWETRREK